MLYLHRKSDGPRTLVRLSTGDAFEVPAEAAGWAWPVTPEAAQLITQDPTLSAWLDVVPEEPVAEIHAPVRRRVAERERDI